MDIKSGNKYPSSALSNFAPHPFEFRGIQCNSMEGLLQSLKYKNPDMQQHVCTLVGITAKRYGSKKNWQETQTLWWNGNPIKRESDEYQQLLDEAFSSLYTQNTKAKNALKSTKNAKLTHSVGRTAQKETVLTKREFCSRLENLRDDITVETLEHE